MIDILTINIDDYPWYLWLLTSVNLWFTPIINHILTSTFDYSHVHHGTRPDLALDAWARVEPDYPLWGVTPL
jgi:hypothetical protein